MTRPATGPTLASRFVPVDGHQVHLVDQGPADAPVLLLLHGNPTSSFLYRWVIHALADEFRCIAPDYPGFGRSTAAAGYGYTALEHATVLERLVVGELDASGVVVVGQDWGGPIGLALATYHTARIAGLVLANTWAWPLAPTSRQAAFGRLWSSPAGRLACSRRNAFVETMLPLGTTTRLPRAVMDCYRAPFPTPASRRPTWIFPRELRTARPLLAAVEARLPELAHLPALLAWGLRDPAFPAATRDRLAAALPRARRVDLPYASHFVQEDAPTELADAIRAWHADEVAAP